MVRKHSLYQLATAVWWLASMASVVLVVSGEAQPYASLSDVPYGVPGAFGIAVVSVVCGTVAIGRLEARSWTKMGRRLGLAPEEGSLFGKPDLAGTVRGRTVRAFTYKVRKGSGGEGGSNSVTYTVVEAQLRDPEQNGYIIGRGEVQQVDDDDIPDQVRQKDIDGGHYLIGDVSADYGRAVLSDPVRDVFGRPDGPGAVVVGDPTDAIMSAIPDDVGGFLGSMVVSGLRSKLEDKRSFDAAMASHSTRGLVLDADELQARVDAVVAVAEAHEAARVEAPRT